MRHDGFYVNENILKYIQIGLVASIIGLGYLLYDSIANPVPIEPINRLQLIRADDGHQYIIDRINPKQPIHAEGCDHNSHL